MPAYVIFDIEVQNPEGYEGYKKLSSAAVAAYGGEFVVRGGQAETLEGVWSPKRLVILKFKDAATAKAWINSEEYREARALRHQYAVSQAVVVDGV
ncbi:MAG: DUF1330 domain-containing protein [Anaerolineales bacterium]|nr:DUF1330 domain-containing protein [Anaerolineales bacterium]MCZ2122616.1 DUF1330 domain-containing protein [Anaerolineales bacterium]